MRYRDALLLSYIEAYFGRSRSFVVSKERNQTAADSERDRLSDLRAALQEDLPARFAPIDEDLRADPTVEPLEFGNACFLTRNRSSFLKLEWRTRGGTSVSFYIRRRDIVPIHHPDTRLKDGVEIQIASDLFTLVDEYIPRFTISQLDVSILNMDGELEPMVLIR